MTRTAAATPLERPGQIAWGAIGGLTPYVVAGLNAVGYRMDFPFPSFGWAPSSLSPFRWASE